MGSLPCLFLFWLSLLSFSWLAGVCVCVGVVYPAMAVRESICASCSGSLCLFGWVTCEMLSYDFTFCFGLTIFLFVYLFIGPFGAFRFILLFWEGWGAFIFYGECLILGLYSLLVCVAFSCGPLYAIPLVYSYFLSLYVFWCLIVLSVIYYSACANEVLLCNIGGFFVGWLFGGCFSVFSA